MRKDEIGAMAMPSFPWSTSDPFPYSDPGVIWPSLSAANDDLNIINGQ